LAQVAGETYNKQLTTTTQVVEENPELYFQIQALNPGTEEVADVLVASVCEWRDTVVRGDAEAFSRLMDECRRYLEGDGR
jgi:prephenate dehydrogenase